MVAQPRLRSDPAGSPTVPTSGIAFYFLMTMSYSLWLKRKVIVAAPVKEGALNIVMGCNDDRYDPETHHLITAASCTTMRQR